MKSLQKMGWLVFPPILDKIYLVSFVLKMDLITKSPGLFHIAEKIFLNLKFQEVLLLKSQQVNENWKFIVRDPLFLYEKCNQIGIFEKNDANAERNKSIILPFNPYEKYDQKVLLKKIIQALAKNNSTRKEIATLTLLEIISEPKQAQNLVSFLAKFYKKYAEVMDHDGLLSIDQFSLSRDSPYFNFHWTNPICWAAFFGHTKIFKILAPITDEDI